MYTSYQCRGCRWGGCGGKGADVKDAEDADPEDAEDADPEDADVRALI